MPIDESRRKEDVGSSVQLLVLCDDMLLEILARLPVRTLIMFKQVSKTWMRIITSPIFIRSHCSIHNSISDKTHKRFFVMHKPPTSITRFREISTTSISVVDDPYQCRIHEEDIRMPFRWRIDSDDYRFQRSGHIHSAGLGLYCLFDFPSFRVSLWNPATGEMKQPPPSPFNDAILNNRRDGRDDAFAFGHVEYSKGDGALSYKVGIICSQIKKQNFSYLHLYSSSTKAWKLFKCDFMYRRPAWGGDAVNFKGKLHLLSASGFLSAPFIITFDYTTERFDRVMEVPPDARSWERYINTFSCLTLYDDRYLCLIMFRTFNPADVDRFFEVWVMREYGVRESWSKVGPTVRYSGVHMRVLNCSMGEVFFEEYDREAAQRRLWLYSCTSASPTLTQLPIVIHVKRSFMCVVPRTESLVSISDDNMETYSF